MGQDIHIDPDGTLHVNGQIITPGSVKTGVSDIEKAVAFLKNKNNRSIKNLEKFLAWGAGVVAATNGFSAAGLPANIREWIVGGSALVLAAIHNNTPDT